MKHALMSGLRTVRDLLARAWYAGRGRQCPICGGGARRFAPYSASGFARRAEARCVWCGSLERHRLAWLVLARHAGGEPGRRPPAFLHVAPEACLAGRLRERFASGYVAADLGDRVADVRMDLTRIPFASGVFGVLYCAHVLEHVVDDRAALAELFRVLAPDGVALLMVPIEGEVTLEDPTITDPRQRRKVFGQSDHVRIYGRDFVARVREAGFRVRRWHWSELVCAQESVVMGIGEAAGELFECTKARDDAARERSEHRLDGSERR